MFCSLDMAPSRKHWFKGLVTGLSKLVGMNITTQKSLKTLCTLGFLFSLFLPAQAKVTWEQVEKRIKASKDYVVKFNYNGAQGLYDFDYRYASKGSKIRTEITNSKSDRTRIGTIIVYDKGWNAGKVRAKTGSGFIVRNLTHKDVKGRPFHEGIFQIILRELVGQPTKATARGKFTLFQFRDGSSIRVNDKAEIVETKRVDKGKREIRKFYNHEWNGSPSTGFKD